MVSVVKVSGAPSDGDDDDDGDGCVGDGDDEFLWNDTYLMK